MADLKTFKNNDSVKGSIRRSPYRNLPFEVIKVGKHRDPNGVRFTAKFTVDSNELYEEITNYGFMAEVN